MLLEAFSNTITRWLRIPPGSSLRKAGQVTTSPMGSSANGSTDTQNEYVDAISSITVDDICVGSEPLSISFEETTPEAIQEKLHQIIDECNSVVRWVAKDLLNVGVSIYTAKISKLNRLILLPYIPKTGELHFYLTFDKKVVAVINDNGKDQVLEDILLFINFDKDSLVPIQEDSDEYAFEIVPAAMQFNSAAKTLASLTKSENNLDRFRGVMSRPARWANVDIGVAQGDQQTDAVDTISAAINANSSGLATGVTEFDDNIPVLPNRRGLGKVELQSDIPNYNLKDLGDLDYYLSKLCLLARFPGTYMDYSKNLDATAASMIRGDIRYAKLCTSVRTKIVGTLNDFIQSSDTFKEYQPVVVLTQLPTSEDDDVMAALENYVDIATKIEDFINEGETKEARFHRLRVLQNLFASSTTSPMLQNVFDELRENIEKQEEADESQGTDMGSDLGDIDSGESFEVPSGIDTEEPTSPNSEVPEGPEDVEIVEPGTL